MTLLRGYADSLAYDEWILKIRKVEKELSLRM